MIAIVCADCEQGIAITPGDDGEVEHLFFTDGRINQELACPQCQMRRLTSEDAAALTPSKYRELTPQEAFAAFSGLGFPEETDCSATAVEAALLANQVVRVVTRPIRGSNRCLLERIDLAGGVSIFLGASVHGATVYRVSGRHSYASEVLRGS